MISPWSSFSQRSGSVYSGSKQTLPLSPSVLISASMVERVADLSHELVDAYTPVSGCQRRGGQRRRPLRDRRVPEPGAVVFHGPLQAGLQRHSRSIVEARRGLGEIGSAVT